MKATEINPNNGQSMDQLCRLFDEENLKAKGFFSSDPGTADYGFQAVWKVDHFSYWYGGHGVGSNQSHIQTSDQLIERILNDNERYNAGKPFCVTILGSDDSC